MNRTNESMIKVLNHENCWGIVKSEYQDIVFIKAKRDFTFILNDLTGVMTIMGDSNAINRIALKNKNIYLYKAAWDYIRNQVENKYLNFLGK